MKNILKISYSIIFLLVGTLTVNAAEKVDLLKTDWSFKGLFGKFDRGALAKRVSGLFRSLCWLSFNEICKL